MTNSIKLIFVYFLNIRVSNMTTTHSGFTERDGDIAQLKIVRHIVAVLTCL